MDSLKVKKFLLISYSDHVRIHKTIALRNSWIILVSIVCPVSVVDIGVLSQVSHQELPVNLVCGSTAELSEPERGSVFLTLNQHKSNIVVHLEFEIGVVTSLGIGNSSLHPVEPVVMETVDKLVWSGKGQWTLLEAKEVVS